MSSPDHTPLNDPDDTVEPKAPLFLSADRVKESVRWRLGDHGLDGPLSADFRMTLAARYDIPEGELLELSRSIGTALNPAERPYVVEVDRAVSRHRGQQNVEAAIAKLSIACAAVDDAEELLRGVETDEEVNEKGRDVVQQVRNHLGHVAPGLIDQIAVLGAHKYDPQLVTLRHTATKQIGDQRRKWFSNCIFALRERHRDKLGYTNTVDVAETSGPLIDFVNDIVGELEDTDWDPLDGDEPASRPRAKLSPNTILNDLKAYTNSSVSDVSSQDV